MKEETITELRTILDEEFNIEIDRDKTEMIAESFVNYFKLLKQIAEKA